MTEKTKVGLFVRNDGAYGLQIFSPYTGLFYSLPNRDSDLVIRWLNGIGDMPNELYKNTIGLEWDVKIKDATLSKIKYEKNNAPEKILVMNWLITGRCTHACKYCYSLDLTEDGIFDDTSEIDSTIKTLLTYDPLVIVLSGGEPMLNKNLEYIVDKLHNKVGIILDTNGCFLTPKCIDFFKMNEIVVRISLDTLIPRNNYRMPKEKKMREEYESKVLDSINMCIEKELPLIIHTVVNQRNRNDLVSMGDKLNQLGVKVWKLIEIVPINKELKIPKDNFDYIHSKIEKHVNRGRWKNMRVIYQSASTNEKSVVLITPIGEYRTQNGNEKTLLDENSPRSPTLIEIKQNLVFNNHMRRYIDGYHEH